MIHNVISPEHVDEAGMKLFLEDLQQAVTARDIVRLIVLIKKMVPGYTPSAQLLQGAGMFTNISADQVSSGESDEASLVCPATIETA
jgi:hypothetical protein